MSLSFPDTSLEKAEASNRTMNVAQKYRFTSIDKEVLAMLRHVVLFGFKDETSLEQIAEVEAGFSALPGQVYSIKDFEWGIDVSVEQNAQGFSHCFVVTFEDEAGRDAYLPHPAHQKFVTLVRKVLKQSLVIDYWSN